MSKSMLMPVRSALMSVRISSELSILSMRARSTLSSLPRTGRMACVSVFRPPLADPPAESPSTMNSSARSTSLVRQSASLAGMEPESSAVFRRVRSRARRAASRAWAATTPRWASFFASAGLVSSHSPSASPTAFKTNASISGLSSFSFGWLLNAGSGSLTETTATRPSRRSSPVGVGSFSLISPALRA